MKYLKKVTSLSKTGVSVDEATEAKNKELEDDAFF